MQFDHFEQKKNKTINVIKKLNNKILKFWIKVCYLKKQRKY